jgi:hypothetical protein
MSIPTCSHYFGRDAIAIARRCIRLYEEPKVRFEGQSDLVFGGRFGCVRGRLLKIHSGLSERWRMIGSRFLPGDTAIM